ncbi:MAG: HAMP domain-containing histidine kinase [Acidobacteria bacterium]|nr:HAMP domain-containing histidine kinase [Acidobacteriota bacterium]
MNVDILLTIPWEFGITLPRNMPLISAKISALRRGWGVSAALLLATAALAGLSIQSVYREAEVRQRLIADTHRSIADVVSARLDAAMLEADRAAAVELQAVDSQAKPLLKKFQELEASRPWLQPIVLVSASRTEPEPAGSSLERFDKLFRAAEQAEYRELSPRRAVRLYASAALQATSGSRRAVALNGQARNELKAGGAFRAAGTYKKLIAVTENLDSREVRLSLIARSQLVSCYALLGNKRDFRGATLDLYQFLIGHRFILDDDTYDFYRGKVEETLATVQAAFDGLQTDLLARLRIRERQMNSVATPLRAALSKVTGADALVAMMPIGGGAHAAHVWTISNARALLERSLRDPGPWSGVGVAIVEESGNSGTAPAAAVPADSVRATLPLARAPNWRVAAFPPSSSVGALASREVTRFAALLILVFGTVVVAMVLAARSVARELALSRMRSDFLASVSHELKTPLSLIRMFAESLREGWVSEDKRAAYYEVITRESERLSSLINNVLDFSRIESGKRTYQRAAADLREIIASLFDRYEYHLKAARIDLIEELPPGPVYASVDKEAIEQMLVNLLSNAVKYMGGAGRRPRVIQVSLSSSGEYAVIRIADTGIGISEEDRAHIFERFWRAGDERVRAVAGSGLGLTLVKHIVEAHDGAIAVESSPGRGSTFTVTLPANNGGRP